MSQIDRQWCIATHYRLAGLLPFTRQTIELPTGKPLLVPLTASLYVPGVLADSQNVIVDVGTGFYVEKVCITTTRVLHLLTTSD
jgi:hypothetical protein